MPPALSPKGGFILDLDKLKEYLRVDGNDDDQLISSLQTAAEEYLTNAGIEQDYKKELYTLAVKLLVSHWYGNRTIQSDKSLNGLRFSLDAIIMQLEYSQEAVE